MNGLKDLLYKIADDQLILGHRNSEWTGLGPVLEEDIAFSSMAQDKVGLARALYEILHKDLGEADPDQIAFNRGDEKLFKCAHLVELPNGEYDFSLARQFFFDHGEMIRFRMLEESSFRPLAELARKVRGEIKYHVLHNDTWLKKLGNGTEESRARMQSAINQVFPLALGVYEPGDYEAELQQEGIFAGEAKLRERWMEQIQEALEVARLELPKLSEVTPEYGGRKGYHTEHLAPLLKEMTEVFSLDPSAEW